MICMSNAYSLDLRERVVAYVQAGGKKVEACRIFQVGHDTLYRWLRQHREEGSLHPRKRGKYKVRKIDDQALLGHIKENPDATLAEIGQTFDVSAVAIWKACNRLDITRKKNASLQGGRSRAAGSFSQRGQETSSDEDGLSR